MQIVIDIPRKTIAHIRSDYGHGIRQFYDEDRKILCEAIYNCTYLPKGHGRLIDADAIKYTHSIARSIDDGYNWNELCVTADEIADAPTVLEAESEE